MATDEASVEELEPLSELVEEVELPGAVEGFSKRRVELVHAAAAEWRRALVDLGGRNNLLSYSFHGAPNTYFMHWNGGSWQVAQGATPVG